MTYEKLLLMNVKLSSLTVFRALLDDPVIGRLRFLIDCLAASDRDDAEDEITVEPIVCVEAYCDLVSELFRTTDSFGAYVRDLVLDSDNVYMRRTAAGEKIPRAMEASVENELAVLSEIVKLKSKDITDLLLYPYELPKWTNSRIDLAAEFNKRKAELPYKGLGMFAKYHMFTIKRGEIVPVKRPDKQVLGDLKAYERERSIIIRNTEVLLSGGAANNVLLYGDAGTGKSSTVKAIVNDYRDKGLRLVEVRKNQLALIPDIIDRLAQEPLKFILFIDDLSFAANDDNFSALKAVLEGSVSATGRNIAIYATSNRRHLVKETMADRTGDELHVNDTLQETASLSERFGLTVVFQRPDKEQYLDIVRQLAKVLGVKAPQAELDVKAETYALRNGGRSPRAAKHFLELYKAGIEGGRLADR